MSGLFVTNKGGTADIYICPFLGQVFFVYMLTRGGNKDENETMV